MTMRRRQSVRSRLSEAVDERNQLMQMLCAVVLREQGLVISGLEIAAVGGLTLTTKPNEDGTEVTLGLTSVGGADITRVM